MPFLVHQCPHCRTERMPLAVLMESAGPTSRDVNVFLHCSNCRRPSVATLQFFEKGRAPPILGNATFSGNLTEYYFSLIGLWPEPEKAKIPDGLPDEVARAYLQAENNFLAKDHEESALAMYRRALEMALQGFKEATGKTLYERIKTLADAQKITPDIAAWCHEIRLAGNEALHDPGKITRGELAALRGLAEMVLTYLFTMPKMLRERKKDAEKSR